MLTVKREQKKYTLKFVKYLLKDKVLQYQNNTDDEVLNEFSEFRIGSLSKTLTLLIILKLHEKKLLNINDKVSNYIKVPDKYKKVTLLHLINHKSGLIREYAGKETIKYKTAGDVYKTFKNENIFSLKINTHSYSNLGYIILSYIIEQITNKSYADSLDEYIIKPFKLKNTGIGKINTTVYQDTHKITKKQFNEIYYATGAGGVYSTVTDMVNIFYNLNEFLKKDTLKIFKNSYMFTNNKFNHNGTIFGGRTQITILFSENLIPIDGIIYFNANYDEFDKFIIKK